IFRIDASLALALEAKLEGDPAQADAISIFEREGRLKGQVGIWTLVVRIHLDLPEIAWPARHCHCPSRHTSRRSKLRRLDHGCQSSMNTLYLCEYRIMDVLVECTRHQASPTFRPGICAPSSRWPAAASSWRRRPIGISQPSLSRMIQQAESELG